MKSQDIVILLRLTSLFDLEREEGPGGIWREFLKEHSSLKLVYTPDLFKTSFSKEIRSRDTGKWSEWSDFFDKLRSEADTSIIDPFSARGLETILGVSKSEVNSSIRRSFESGLAVKDRSTNRPRPVWRNLKDFLLFGLKYVFPAKVGTIQRGIPTAFSATVLQGEVISAGQYDYVWPSPDGEHVGLSVEPLFKTVPAAVKKDKRLYEYLALVDAIRLGNQREAGRAREILSEKLDRQ